MTICLMSNVKVVAPHLGRETSNRIKADAVRVGQKPSNGSLKVTNHSTNGSGMV